MHLIYIYLNTKALREPPVNKKWRPTQSSHLLARSDFSINGCDFRSRSGSAHLHPGRRSRPLGVRRDDRLSVTLLVLNPPSPSKSNPFAELLASVSSSGLSSRIRFVELPWEEIPPPGPTSKHIFHNLAERYKPVARAAVARLTQATDSPPLTGFMIDMFCSPMIDVANEFGVPTYLFFTCSAAFLGFMFHAQALQDEEGKDLSEFTELLIPALANPVPAKVFPRIVLDEGTRGEFLGHAKKFRETKGITVNTFKELEVLAVKALNGDDNIPLVYPAGPVLNLTGTSPGKSSDIIGWLDRQPRSSVVFLCFGSVESFYEDQVREIAGGLERSGHRFLWSLRQSPPKGAAARSFPEDYDDPAEVLPEGFLERTSERGKVIGWAPQVEVLAHPSVGGFVTHCGWNSTLEGLWFGIPTAAWPLYAEQQFNAFAMVVEHGLAVEVKMDYMKDVAGEVEEAVVGAEVIERAVRELMEADNGGRKEGVRRISEQSRAELLEGGSFHRAVGQFISAVFDNMS